MNFNIILSNLRTSHKLTQDDLAKILNVSKITIDMYESGVREPNYEILCAISDYFNVDIDFLLGHQAITNDAPDVSSSVPILNNKQIMAQNLYYYMHKQHMNQTDLCKALDFKMSTFSDWLHAKSYPRIDKVELIANYFGIQISDLIEQKNTYLPESSFNELFSRKLRYYMKKKNITQAELSQKIGVGTTSVYNWCNGIKTPRMDKVDMMCTIFECSRSDLMTDTSSVVVPASLDINLINQLNVENVEKINIYAQKLLDIQAIEDT